MILNSNLLEKMCAAYGPSGREHRIRQMIAEEIKDYADDIKEDAIGNLIVHKTGKGRKIKGCLCSGVHSKQGKIPVEPVSGGVRTGEKYHRVRI